MNVLTKLTRGRAERIAAIEAELDGLTAKAAVLVKEIDDLARAEDEIEDAAAMAKSMAAHRAAQNRLRKLDTEIEAKREELAMARDAARAKRRDELIAAFRAAAPKYIEMANKTHVAFKALLAAREALENEGFRSEYLQTPVPPALGGFPAIAPDILDNFAAELAPQVRPSTRPPERQLPPAPARQGGHGPVYANWGHEIAPANKRPAPARRPLLVEKAEPGQVLFGFARDGVELPNKGQMYAGDIVAMTVEQADALLRSGAGDLVSKDTADSMAGLAAEMINASAASPTVQHIAPEATTDAAVDQEEEPEAGAPADASAAEGQTGETAGEADDESETEQPALFERSEAA